MSNDKATPRPWMREQSVGVTGGDGGLVAWATTAARVDLPPRTTRTAKANAALIVRAVNAHDDLVAACEAVLAEHDSDIDAYDPVHQSSASLCALRAALERAKGA